MSHQDIIQTLIEWIDEHIDQPLNIDIVARKSGYSKWYLQRMFRTVMHQTLGDYIRQRRLLLAHFGHTQVVEPEIGRQVGLVMPPKERPCLHHVAPLRESGAPPPVVLRERVVLRQVEGDDSFGMLLHTIRFSGALRRAARSVRSDRQHRVSCAFRNSDSIRKNSNLIRIFGYSQPQEPVAKSFYFHLAVGFREFRDACRQAMQSFSPRGTRDRIFSYFCAR